MMKTAPFDKQYHSPHLRGLASSTRAVAPTVMGLKLRADSKWKVTCLWSVETDSLLAFLQKTHLQCLPRHLMATCRAPAAH